MPATVRPRLRAAAVLLVIGAAVAAAQLPTIDLGAITQLADQVRQVTAVLDQVTAFREHMDAQVAAATAPFEDLASAADALRQTTLSIPATLGAPPAVGGRLGARLAAAGAFAPDAPDDDRLVAAATPVTTEDPLSPGAAAEAGPLLTALRAGGAAAAASRQADIARDRAALETAGTAANVLGDAERSLRTRRNAAGGADESWTSIQTRMSASLETLTVLQHKALEIETVELEARLLQRERAAQAAAALRGGAIDALAAGRAALRDRLEDPNRDAGDDRLADCAGRLFLSLIHI